MILILRFFGRNLNGFKTIKSDSPIAIAPPTRYQLKFLLDSKGGFLDSLIPETVAIPDGLAILFTKLLVTGIADPLAVVLSDWVRVADDEASVVSIGLSVRVIVKEVELLQLKLPDEVYLATLKL